MIPEEKVLQIVKNDLLSFLSRLKQPYREAPEIVSLRQTIESSKSLAELSRAFTEWCNNLLEPENVKKAAAAPGGLIKTAVIPAPILTAVATLAAILAYQYLPRVIEQTPYYVQPSRKEKELTPMEMRTYQQGYSKWWDVTSALENAKQMAFLQWMEQKNIDPVKLQAFYPTLYHDYITTTDPEARRRLLEYAEKVVSAPSDVTSNVVNLRMQQASPVSPPTSSLSQFLLDLLDPKKLVERLGGLYVTPPEQRKQQQSTTAATTQPLQPPSPVTES